MGLLTFAGRIVLVVLNIFFMLFSLTLVIAGFIIRFGHEILRPYLKTTLESIENTVKDVYNDADFSTENLELGDAVSGLAAAMIVVGLALLAFSFVGCCGACYSFTTLMLVYSIVLIVILLAQVIMVIIAFGAPNTIKDNIEPEMKKSLEEYQGLNGTTLISLVWNYAMQEFDCCGAKDYTDFASAAQWWGKDSKLTPIACCKTLPTSSATDTDMCAGNKALAAYDSIEEIAALSNHDMGCVDALWNQFMTFSDYFYIVIGICFAAQLVLIIFACLVYKDRGIKGHLI